MIVLTGFMGAGKSTVGRLLGARLGIPFDDLDDAVSARAGMTVPEIFAAHGEAGFREREAAALAALLGSADRVIGLGGGTLSAPGVRDALRGRARLVYLRTSEAELRRRLSATDPATRPLLADGFPADLLAARHPTYATADLVVDTDGRDPGAVVDALVELLAPGDRP